MPHTTSSLVISIVVLSASFTATVRAQDPLYALNDKIGPVAELVPDAFFGASVDTDAGRAVVGSPGSNRAFVYVQGTDGWLVEAEIVPPDLPGELDYYSFGAAVAISGDVIAVGAPDARKFGYEEGVVCVFRRSTVGVWELEQEFELWDLSLLGDHHFGASVAISGGTILVGGPDHRVSGEPIGSGAAFIFGWTGAVWHLDQRLTAAFQDTGDHFGAAVSLSGDTAVIGAPNDDALLAPDAGLAFVFTSSGGVWSQAKQLKASDAGSDDHFGAAVSVAIGRILVGAPDADHAAGTDAGAAYVFTGSGLSWTQDAILTAGDADTNDFFGAAVVVTTFGAAAVGAPGDNLGMLQADAGSAYVFEYGAGSWVEMQKLTDPISLASDGFGSSITLNGDTLLVGVANDNLRWVDDAGSVQVFIEEAGTWIHSQGLQGQWGLADYDQWFGSDVAVDGDTMVVGVPDSATHCVHVLVRDGDTWSRQQELCSPLGAIMNDGFGQFVAISGDTVVVGAHDSSTATIDNCGLAYVYVRTSTISGPLWELQRRLEASNAIQNAHFGWDVAIDDDTIAVGTNGVGSVYVFNRSGTLWTEDQILRPSAPIVGHFGWSVAVKGDVLAAGAPFYDGANTDSGTAYVFRRAGSVWTEEQMLIVGDLPSNAQFGHDVAVDETSLIVGAVQADAPGQSDAGAAYVFVESGSVWTLEQKLTATNPSSGSRFGDSTTILDDLAVVGSAFWTISAFNQAGAAYVFKRSGGAWTEHQFVFGSPIEAGAVFGTATAIASDGILVAAPFEEYRPIGDGAVYWFMEDFDEADLAVTIDDGQTEAVPGTPITYDITVTNAGPVDTLGASVSSAFPAELVGCAWTCVGSFGGTCTPGPVAGDISDTVDIPVAAQLDYSVDCIIDPAAAAGDLVTTATVASPPGVADPDQLNNTGIDTSTLTPLADLSITKDNGTTEIMHLQTTIYTIQVANTGPSDAPMSPVNDLFPLALTSCSWTCTPSPGATCPAGSIGDIDNPVSLPAGTSATFLATCTVRAAYGQCTNTAVVHAQSGLGVTDPDLGNNESTDTDDVIEDPDLIFFDHFETGDTSWWSATVP